MPPHAEWHALLVDKVRRQLDMIRRNLTVWCGCGNLFRSPWITLQVLTNCHQVPAGNPRSAFLSTVCASLSYCALLQRLTMSFGSSLPLCAFPNAVGGPSSHHPGRPSIDVSG